MHNFLGKGGRENDDGQRSIVWPFLGFVHIIEHCGK